MLSLQAFCSGKMPVKGSLSLDRVTFLVYSPGLSLWGPEADRRLKQVEMLSNYLEKKLDDVLDPDFPQGIPSELFRKHYRTSGGVDIQFGPVMPRRKKVTDLDYVMLFGTDSDKENGFLFRSLPNEYAFRVEYNPNESELSEIYSLLQYFRFAGITASQVRIARLDIAIDYRANVNPSLCLCDRMRKSFIASGPLGIETVYFGSRTSQFYIRLYNKALELSEKHNINVTSPLWRFELESKKSFMLDTVPDFSAVLQRFSFYGSGLKSDDWKLNLLLSFASDHGLKAALALLPPATQKRYKRLLDDFSLDDSLESPFTAYERDFQSAFSVLRLKILTALGHEILL